MLTVVTILVGVALIAYGHWGWGAYAIVSAILIAARNNQLWYEDEIDTWDVGDEED